MTDALPPSNDRSGARGIVLPTGFLAVCLLVFAGGVSLTIYFCRSMCCEMEMPGGWAMSMMWMRMPGQTQLASAGTFLLMWEAMMVAMMMPSAFPTFLKTGSPWPSLCRMASGYFAVWLAAGVAVYALGLPFAAAAMRSHSFSRVVPVILTAALLAAGAVQFTPWKLRHLLRCRSPFGCAAARCGNNEAFQLGCRQGIACCACCIAPMTIQLALGIMNPFVMISIALVIAAEKLLPHPTLVARLVGASAVIAGMTSLVGVLLRLR